MQTSQLLSRLPHQLSTYQRRMVGFVRCVLMEPAMLVYTAIWHGVTESEHQQLLEFDAILRRELPACTVVFVDYDNTLEAVLPAQQSYYL
jgi:ABC-type proline/glycine betaine transport system ATPase subunit